MRLRYRLDIDDASPEEAVAGTRVPVLLIHGQSDTNIPVRHSRRIAARNSGVALWEVPNTGHSNAIDTSPAELERRLISWFAAHANVMGH
jgi:pimeloyl-ACP methyl ester carboxylesterase